MCETNPYTEGIGNTLGSVHTNVALIYPRRAIARKYLHAVANGTKEIKFVALE